MKQMSQALRSAQQSLSQAGQQTAQGARKGQQGQQGQQGSEQNSATEAEMGKEFGKGEQEGAQKSGQQSASAASSKTGASQNNRSSRAGSGGGLGNAGIGRGGHVGPQQPLPGHKKDELVKGSVNDRGQKLTRTYMGTPDPTQDKAAYYSVVPDRVRAAESTLNREDIPASYKNQVKEYFNSIQPR